MKPERPVLEVRNLTVSVRGPEDARLTVVDDVSFSLDPGTTLGIVGESGSGKTMTSMAVMGLLPPGARVDSGEVLLEGENLLQKSPREMRALRGKRIAMVLQDPLTALDPSFSVRSQLARPLALHRGLRGAALSAAVGQSLEQVHLSAAKERLNQYPHQLSGGMRQRVTSAIALSGSPRVLIADEPTTALDATTQVRYLQLLRELQETSGFALLLIAHDLLIVRLMCERVLVMYAGRAVEEGPAREAFSNPQHPYTSALVRAVPVLDREVLLESIPGQAPSLTEEVEGCRFAPRCNFARDVCLKAEPGLSPRDAGRQARCHGTAEDGWIPSGELVDSRRMVADD